jgi:hypothetical protein
LLLKAINVSEDNKAIVYNYSIAFRVVYVWFRYTKIFTFDFDFRVKKDKKHKYKTKGINRIIVKN